MSFKERLYKILDGRPIKQWAGAHHISSGTIGRISTGHIPGQQMLHLIQRVENASVNWLIDGTGLPFLIHEEPNDRAMANYLQALFDETSWTAYLLTDKQAPAIALVQPGEIDFKGKTVPYQITEIVTGQLGPQTLETFNRYPGGRCWVSLSGEEMDEINQGRVGSYRLGRLIEDADTISGPLEWADVVDQAALAESLGTYGNDEQALLAGYRRLSPHNQESVHMIIDALLEAQAENVHNLAGHGYGVQPLSARIGHRVAARQKKS